MYDIIGDVHNCSAEFFAIINKLGYTMVDGLAEYPNRTLVSVGDLFDRGPNFTPIFLFVRDMVKAGKMICVMGNHCNKLWRWCKGNNVMVNHGLDKSIRGIEQAEKDGLFTREDVKELLGSFPYYIILDNNNLILSHAAWKKSLVKKKKTSGKVRSYCLYGPVSGFTDDNMPIRIDWAKDYKSEGETIVTGHQVYKDVRNNDKVWQIDTGCVFGNQLSVLRYPEMEVVKQKAYQAWDDSKLSDNSLFGED